MSPDIKLVSTAAIFFSVRIVQDGRRRDYALAGCGQVMPGPRAHFLNDTGLMNAAKVLEHMDRARSLGANLILESEPGRGTRVMVELPLSSQEG